MSSGRRSVRLLLLVSLACVSVSSITAGAASTIKTRTSVQEFGMAICKAIYAKWEWPADAVLAGELGATILQFKYYEGKASDIGLVTSGGMTKIDQSFIRALRAAQLPPAPSWLPPKPLLMEAELHDNLGVSDICSTPRVSIIQNSSQSPQSASPPSGP